MRRSRAVPPGAAVAWRLVTAAVLACYLATMPADATVYLNQWAVEIDGGPGVADAVAAENGFRNLGQIGSLDRFYLFEQRRMVKRSASPARRHHVRLEQEPRVRWLEQQSVRRRVKRTASRSDYWKWSWNDPLWPKMWYLNRGAHGAVDMNVVSAWQLGYTGRGIVVTILDDGIEHNHTDLQLNYDPDASYDINGLDADPMPRYDAADDNRHGTRCAGQVASVANNRKCTVGVAFNARIGGIRMLDGDVSDSVEAQALSFNPQHIDIYSASWGPEDNGRVVEGPDKLAREAFLQGILKGRGGLGSIYVWASGNGGSRSDSCSCDGYANSVYTLSVSSTSEHGTRPWYLEECSSTLAATYSSGENYRERKILTTDIHNQCTDDHTGTSASAPLAAGMCALALEANPTLTWRDMQHIVVMSSRTEPLRDAYWIVNGVGRKVSHRYGYGLMDAEAMVKLAERWTTVPQQQICFAEPVVVNQTIEKHGMMLKLATDGCIDTERQVIFLEHVQVKISLTYSRRGDLQLHLLSPAGTPSTLLPRRKDDYEPGKLESWHFLSVFYWGERPNGTWTLILENVGSELNAGHFDEWQLIFYGTTSTPVSLVDTPQSDTKPTVNSTTTGFTTATSAAKISTPTIDNITTSNVTFGAGVSAVTVADGVTTAEPIAEQLTATGNFSVGTASSSSSNVSVVKNLTVKDSDAENSTELKSGVLINGTFVTLPPAVVAAHVSDASSSEENTTVNFVGSSLTVTTASVDPLISNVQNVSVQSAANATGANRRHENASTLDITVPNSRPAAVVNVTVSFLDSETAEYEESPDHTVTATEVESSVPMLLYGEMCSSECSVDGCFGPLSSDCVSCRHLQLSLTGECVASCPQSTYEVSGVCESCPLPCDECVADVDDQSVVCLSCIVGRYLVSTNNVTSCTGLCPERHYADDIVGRCVLCDMECLRCTDLPSVCTQCVDGYELFEYNCIVPCGILQFRASDGSCQPCDASCSACTGPAVGDCIDCAVNWWWEIGACVQNCSEGYYGVVLDEQRLCQMCHPSCMTCFGPGELDCLTCFHPLKLTGTTCLESCLPGHYEGEFERCYICDWRCETCFGPNPNNCLSCHHSKFYLHGECVSRCPVGYFESTSLVASSRSSMVEDFDTAASEEVNHLIESKHNNGISSLGGQPSGLDSLPDKQCVHCHATCASCVGQLSTDCIHCSEGLLWSRGRCLPTCDFLEYAEDGVCRPCHESCLSCSGPSSSDCNSCMPDRFLHSGSCVQTCPPGFHAVTPLCEPCPEPCKTCDVGGACTSCVWPRVLNDYKCLFCCDDAVGRTSDCCICDDAKGACIVSSRAPTVTTSWSESTAASSTTVLVNFTYINASTTVSSAPKLVHPTSTVTSAVGDQLMSPVTQANIEEVTGREAASRDMPDLHNSSVVAAVSVTSVVASLSPSNDTGTTSSKVPSTFSNMSAISTSSGLPTDDVTSVAPSPSSTIPDADLLTTSSVPDLSGTLTPEYFRPPPLWTSIIAIVLCLSALVVLFVILVVCLVRARSRHKLCWTKHRFYLPVTLLYQNGSRAAVVLDSSASGTASTVVNGTLAKGPELAPLTYV